MAASGLMTQDAVKRPAARLLIINPRNEILLFCYSYKSGPLAGTRFWATPGGVLEPGESFEEAARRELMEETGIAAQIGTPVHIHLNRFPLPSGRIAEAEERFFLIFTDRDHNLRNNPDATEQEAIADARWWRFEDIAITLETIYPLDILSLLEKSTGSNSTKLARRSPQ